MCFKCFEPRPRDGSAGMMGGYGDFGGGAAAGQWGAGGFGPAAGGMPRGGGAPFRPGDWNCRECNEHNFANRQECFRCRAIRPRDV